MTPAQELASLPLAQAREAYQRRAEETAAEWRAAWAARVWAEIQAGRTRADIAAELGISQPAVSALLTGAGYPPGGKTGRPSKTK